MGSHLPFCGTRGNLEEINVTNETLVDLANGFERQAAELAELRRDLTVLIEFVQALAALSAALPDMRSRGLQFGQGLEEKFKTWPDADYACYVAASIGWSAAKPILQRKLPVEQLLQLEGSLRDAAAIALIGEASQS